MALGPSHEKFGGGYRAAAGLMIDNRWAVANNPSVTGSEGSSGVLASWLGPNFRPENPDGGGGTLFA